MFLLLIMNASPFDTATVAMARYSASVWVAALLLVHFALAQFPPKPEGLTTLLSKFHPGIIISYKEVSLMIRISFPNISCSTFFLGARRACATAFDPCAVSCLDSDSRLASLRFVRPHRAFARTLATFIFHLAL